MPRVITRSQLYLTDQDTELHNNAPLLAYKSSLVEILHRSLT